MIIDLGIFTRFVENARRSINLWWQARFVDSKKKSDETYLYINVEEIIEINVRVTHIIGQLRDRAGLESALMRPQTARHYEDADIAKQAALLVDGICTAHPFVDGNKRTALIACTTFLYVNGYKLSKADNYIGREIERLVVDKDIEYFTQWLRKRIKPI